MLIVFLVKPPAATGQSHSSTNCACPDIRRARAWIGRIFAPPSASGGLRIGCGAGGSAARVLSGLSWTEIRLNYTASIAARPEGSRGGRACSAPRPDAIHSGAVEMTVVAKFINQGPGTCED